MQKVKSQRLHCMPLEELCTVMRSLSMHASRVTGAPIKAAARRRLSLANARVALQRA